MSLDPDAYRDLLTFARIEVLSGDIEPWAELILALDQADVTTLDQALWLVKLYNAFDTFDAAFGIAARWDRPEAWAADPDRAWIVTFMPTQERRNLRGGRVVKHLDSYVENLGGMDQWSWLQQVIRHDDPALDFDRLAGWTRNVWGVGRQTAYEWAEFVGKLTGEVEAGDAMLWESEGPRRSLQRLYDEPTPTPGELDWMAVDLRNRLADDGVPLAWWDFETVICDFNVMRDGRYYPGRHLAAVREELDGAPEAWRPALEAAWCAIVPPEWRDIAPGIDAAKKGVYRATGTIIDRPHWSAA